MDFFDHVDGRGRIFGFDLSEKFSTKRVFFVEPKGLEWRGRHFHVKTTQLIFVIRGSVEVEINRKDRFTMRVGSRHTQVPGNSFAFRASSDDALIAVLADREYDAEDCYVE